MKNLVLVGSLLLFLGINPTSARALVITGANIQPHLQNVPGTGFAQFFFALEGSANPVSLNYSGQLLSGGGLEQFTVTITLSPISPQASRIDADNRGPGGRFEGFIEFEFGPGVPGGFNVLTHQDSPTLGVANLPTFEVTHGEVSWGVPPAGVPEGGSTLLLLALPLSIGGALTLMRKFRSTGKSAE